MIDFIVSTIVVYSFYYLFMINKYDKNGKLKEKKSGFLKKIYYKIKLFLYNSKNEKDEILNRGRKTKKIKKKRKI